MQDRVMKASIARGSPFCTLHLSMDAMNWPRTVNCQLEQPSCHMVLATGLRWWASALRSTSPMPGVPVR